MDLLTFVVAYFAIAITLKMFLWRVVLRGDHKPKIRVAKSLILAVLFGPSLIIYGHGVIPSTALMTLVFGVSLDIGLQIPSIEILLIFFISVLVTSITLYVYYTSKWYSDPKAAEQRKENLSGVTELVKKAHKK